MATLKARPPWTMKLDNMISVPGKIFDYWPDVSEWKVTIDKTKKTVTWEEDQTVKAIVQYLKVKIENLELLTKMELKGAFKTLLDLIEKGELKEIAE